MRGEIEQSVINDSVIVDTTKRMTIVKLPLMHDPVVKLAPNRHKALKVLKQQIKRLSKSPDDKKAIIKAENKLQDMGFVAYVKDLPEDIQKMLRDSPIKNFLPWRIADCQERLAVNTLPTSIRWTRDSPSMISLPRE